MSPSSYAPQLAAVTVSVVLTLALGEVFARFLPAPDGFAARFSAFAREALEPDARLGHRPRAGATVVAGGVEYRVGAPGVRGALGEGGASEGAAGEDAPLLLVLGDSVSFGWGVSEAEAWPQQLERRLREEGAAGARVINAAMPGWGIEQYVARFEELVPALAPQIVLVGYYPNDAEGAESAPGLGGPKWSALWRMISPGIHGLLLRAGLRPTATEHHLALHQPDTASWLRVEEGFTRLGLLCRRHEVQCVAVLLPQLHGTPYPLADVHDRLARLAISNGLGAIDLAQVLEGDPRRFWVQPDDSHPNAALHAEFGRAVAAEVGGALLGAVEP